MYAEPPSSGEATLVPRDPPCGSAGSDAAPGPAFAAGSTGGPEGNPRGEGAEASSTSTRDWPQLSRSAAEELATLLEALVRAVERDPVGMGHALLKCGVPVPWFEQSSPGRLLGALEGLSPHEEIHRPPLHSDLEQRCRTARAELERLVPGVGFDDGSGVPSLVVHAARIKSNARGVSLHGQLTGVIVSRGVAVGTAYVWLPSAGFRFADDGPALAAERTSLERSARCPLSSPEDARSVLRDLARAARGGGRSES